MVVNHPRLGLAGHRREVRAPSRTVRSEASSSVPRTQRVDPRTDLPTEERLLQAFVFHHVPERLLRPSRTRTFHREVVSLSAFVPVKLLMCADALVNARAITEVAVVRPRHIDRVTCSASRDRGGRPGKSRRWAAPVDEGALKLGHVVESLE